MRLLSGAARGIHEFQGLPSIGETVLHKGGKAKHARIMTSYRLYQLKESKKLQGTQFHPGIYQPDNGLITVITQFLKIDRSG